MAPGRKKGIATSFTAVGGQLPNTSLSLLIIRKL